MKNTFLIPFLISRKLQFVTKLTKYEALSEKMTVDVNMTRPILYLCRGDGHFVSKLTTSSEENSSVVQLFKSFYYEATQSGKMLRLHQ